MGSSKRNKTGMKKEAITMRVKKDIIHKHEHGMRVSEIAKFYNRRPSTICTILKKKEEIKRLNAAHGVTRLSKQRPRALEDVEKLLLVWLTERQVAGDSVSDLMICEKAKALYHEIVSSLPSTSVEGEEVFKASRGWFDNFKKRISIHNDLRPSEPMHMGAMSAETFPAEFRALIDSEGYVPQQVFNCEETGLFWKRMPKRTFIREEEIAVPGHKPMKDRLSILLCANASGDLKVKPLLVYHSENPRAFKKFKVQKSQLNVLWRSNTKAWVTRMLFVEWMNVAFGPEVKKYLLERNLPLKALLIMNNSPSHPPDLEDDLLEEFQFITLKFFPPLTTPILQPMDQQIMSTFKKLYTRALFQRCFEVTEGMSLSLRDFWKNHFNIVNCLKLLDKAWDGITKKSLIAAWGNLWPDLTFGYELESLPEVDSNTIVDEIVSLGATLGLDVNEADIEELLEEHTQELTVKELVHLHGEQQKEILESISSGDEEDDKSENFLTSLEIREMCRIWEALQDFVEKHHPNKTVAMRAINQFNDNAMSHFSEILRKRKKQEAPEVFVVKVLRK